MIQPFSLRFGASLEFKYRSFVISLGKPLYEACLGTHHHIPKGGTLLSDSYCCFHETVEIWHVSLRQTAHDLRGAHWSSRLSDTNSGCFGCWHVVWTNYFRGLSEISCHNSQTRTCARNTTSLVWLACRFAYWPRERFSRRSANTYWLGTFRYS